MKHVRLPLTSREFLMTHVDSENLVRENTECKELLLEAMRYHLMPEQRSSLTTIRTTSRYVLLVCTYFKWFVVLTANPLSRSWEHKFQTCIINWRRPRGFRASIMSAWSTSSSTTIQNTQLIFFWKNVHWGRETRPPNYTPECGKILNLLSFNRGQW